MFLLFKTFVPKFFLCSHLKNIEIFSTLTNIFNWTSKLLKMFAKWKETKQIYSQKWFKRLIRYMSYYADYKIFCSFCVMFLFSTPKCQTGRTKHTHIHTHKRARTHTHTQARAHAHTHTHTHIYIYIYIYILWYCRHRVSSAWWLSVSHLCLVWCTHQCVE